MYTDIINEAILIYRMLISYSASFVAVIVVIVVVDSDDISSCPSSLAVASDWPSIYRWLRRLPVLEVVFRGKGDVEEPGTLSQEKVGRERDSVASLTSAH